MNPIQQGLPATLRKRPNRAVLAYLRNASAHSDIAEAFMDSVAPLGDVQLYCPDLSRYRYVLAATKNVIFGFALGMKTIAFRLNPLFKARALATGATDLNEIGPDWAAFTLFRHDWPEVDLKFWARQSYVLMRQTNRVQ